MYVFKQRFDYLGVPLTSNGYLDAIAVSQGLESPRAWASFIGAMARPDGGIAALEAFQSVAYYESAGKKLNYDLLGRLEANRRIPIDAACTALAGQYPLNLAGAWYGLSKFMQTLPIDVALPKYREAYQKDLAQAAVKKFMVKLRTRFEENRDQGQDDIGINGILREFNVVPFETKEYYDKFTVQNAKELEPFASRISTIATM